MNKERNKCGGYTGAFSAGRSGFPPCPSLLSGSKKWVTLPIQTLMFYNAVWQIEHIIMKNVKASTTSVCYPRYKLNWETGECEIQRLSCFFFIQKTIKQVCISYRRLPINLHSLPGAHIQGPAWGISLDLLSFLTRLASCQNLQTSLCSCEQTITKGSFFRTQYTSDIQLFAGIPLRPLGQAQSLFGLPQPLNYSKIFYIMIISPYAVK